MTERTRPLQWGVVRLGRGIPSTGTLHLVILGAVRGFLRFFWSFTNFPSLLDPESSALLMTFRGQTGLGVYFPHGEFAKVSELVVGTQANNRAQVLAVRAAIQRVSESQELCLYGDSKWCVDIFSNQCAYTRRGWMAYGKKPVRNHDTCEEIYQMC